ISY
ncbi:hypothetical protein CP8484711_0618B, partial [Chlamydia psittaci 84-8471/1]